MPQIKIGKRTIGENVKGLTRFIATGVAKTIWPLIPESLFFNNIPRVSIALTRKCNANCTFCAYQVFEDRFKKTMQDDVFEIVLRSLKKNSIKNVMLSPNIGEPLLVPDFLGKIKAMREAGVEIIELTTNGSLLSKIGIDDFLEYGPDIINISFAGFDEEMCKRIYRTPKYQDIRNSILELLFKNHKRKIPKIVNVWLRGDIEVADQLRFPEIEIVRKYAAGIGVMTEVDSWNGKITQEMLTGTMKLQTKIPKIKNRPCQVLLCIAVHPDGDIYACSCRNINNDSDLYLGNIREIELHTAYNNVKKIFAQWKKGCIPPICQTCCMYYDPAVSFLGTIRSMMYPKN